MKNSPLIDLLKSDLERYYFYNGLSAKRVSFFHLYKCFIIPRCMLATSYRISHSMYKIGLTPIAQLISWLAFFIFGSEINCKTVIGPYLYFPHSNGIVIGADRVGAYALIYHQVTIGASRIDFEGDNRPVIGNNVTIGSGAKVLGKLEVPDNSLITANQVVTKSNVNSLKICRRS